MSFLTIGIPAFNGAFNFKDLMQSINLLGLEPHEFEILVVDNASDDDTVEVIQTLSRDIPNLRFYQNETNIGRIQNWNKVIDQAKGDYLILMNANDRFVDFDLKRWISYLDKNPETSLVMSDIINVYPLVTYAYPEWKENGVFKFDTYIKESFLNPDILEFYSLGVLHQHIFRLKTIKESNIQFDEKIPRTTDRVFVAEVIAKGNSTFYYTGQAMVKWVSNEHRYHFAAQQNLKNFDFNALWLNEYKANLALTTLAGISIKDFLKSQAMYAKYMYHTYKLKQAVDFVKRKAPSAELEEVSAIAYYYYIKVQCDVNNIKLNFLDTDFPALKKKLIKPLRRFKLLRKADRSMEKALVN
ncbi:MAG: glycosyltransferase family 2 protein [Sphingobacteriaceae bacterium]|nr:MAG: glycosyltransferase family 2 protein [Sphingobacteriaceae bacterium]